MIDVQLNETSRTPENMEEEIRKLRLLLLAAEERAKTRFAMIDLADQSLLIVTTSSSEPTHYERTLLACFAKPWADSMMTFLMGEARGMIEVATKAWGDDEARWPKSVRDAVSQKSERASELSIASVELTRIAMAPFGLAPTHSDGVSVWAERTKGGEP